MPFTAPVTVNANGLLEYQVPLATVVQVVTPADRTHSSTVSSPSCPVGFGGRLTWSPFHASPLHRSRAMFESGLVKLGVGYEVHSTSQIPSLAFKVSQGHGQFGS